MARGTQARLGKMALLREGNIDLVVASERSQTLDSEPFTEMGIDVSRYKIVALKSSNHFRAGFQELAREIVTADPPGLTTLRVEIFPRHNKPVPLWPMDDEVQYRPREA